ncbi:SRPBCC family protein [Prosthecobacter sp.]|uniref:SRPBCC family protein n=1 Tax=Prosthecobacter sp. TaxID=1965333 RepID=UPI001D5471C5|nr:SRPBCC family protein [Prosthecobacter sp.]MCB1278427.1 SRPBCC family protein [Prosthecobacter sp.]
MIKKLLIGLVVLVVAILAAALLKSPDFRVERSLVIAAPAEKIFPWFDSHKKFNEFNPWLKMDPDAKVEYTGPESGVGAASTWDGKLTGKGKATTTESRPNELIRLRMDWMEPMEGVSTVDYTFAPEGGGKTKVTWAMYGTNEGLLAKVMSLVFNCESMCGPEFKKGLTEAAKLITAPAAP